MQSQRCRLSSWSGTLTWVCSAPESKSGGTVPSGCHPRVGHRRASPLVSTLRQNARQRGTTSRWPDGEVQPGDGTNRRCITSQNPSSWSQHLLWVEYSNNLCPVSSTGLSLFQCVYGYLPSLFPVLEMEVAVWSAHVLVRCYHLVWRRAWAALLHASLGTRDLSIVTTPWLLSIGQARSSGCP